MVITSFSIVSEVEGPSDPNKSSLSRHIDDTLMEVIEARKGLYNEDLAVG